jgi:hypothetical protein
MRPRCCFCLLQEDLILPHHFSFYDLIINKARGKSGPLFDFGVRDDIRILGDAGVESQDVHAGKVGVIVVSAACSDNPLQQLQH